MPDVQWFPQSKLNFAENLLRHGKGPSGKRRGCDHGVRGHGAQGLDLC